MYRANEAKSQGKQVQRDIQTLISYGIFELVKKGQQWKEGVRVKSSVFVVSGFGFGWTGLVLP